VAIAGAWPRGGRRSAIGSFGSGRVVARRAGDEAAARVALEAQAERARADQLGRGSGAGNAQRHRQRIDAIGVAERHLEPARCRLDDAQLDRSRLARRERIDAQLVVVADRRLQQAGVDAAPRDVLEHLLRARLLDRHRGAQPPVDVEGEAAHDLSGRERELELAFEDAVVGVEEDHLHRGLGGAAGDLDVDLQRGEPDRLLGALHLEHRRAPGRDRRRDRAGNGAEIGGASWAKARAPVMQAAPTTARACRRAARKRTMDEHGAISERRRARARSGTASETGRRAIRGESGRRTAQT
jgi:hypothetical protein